MTRAPRAAKIIVWTVASMVMLGACAARRHAEDATAKERASQRDAQPFEPIARDGDAADTAVDAGATPKPNATRPLVPSSDVPRAPKLRVRTLPRASASADKASCSADLVLTRLGTGCRRLQTSAPEGTGPEYPSGGSASPPRAFDGDVCSLWSSGGSPPQAIRAQISDDAPVSGVLLVPEMTPSGQATHVVELDETRSFVAEATWTSEATHFVVFDRPERASSIAVRTPASVSWVAWREVLPFTCERVAIPEDAKEASPKTPEPPSAELVEVARAGMGACAKDDDCVPATCCHPKTCTSRATAPRCEGVGCAQSVVPGTIGYGARCACIKRRCGAIARERVRPGGGLL